MRSSFPENWISIARLATYPEELNAHKNAIPWLPALLSWIYNVVAKPNPNLNRGGALCPFVPPSLDRDLLFVAVARVEMNDAALIQFMDDQLQTFLAADPCPPNPDHVYKSILIAFPDLSGDEIRTLKRFDIVVKPRLLEHGVTCGDFYPDNDDRSARNTALRIATSPVPLIAMRYLTPHDELFLRSQPDLYPIFHRWMEGNRNGR